MLPCCFRSVNGSVYSSMIDKRDSLASDPTLGLPDEPYPFPRVDFEATDENLLKAITEFVNLPYRPSVADCERFVKRWPGFIGLGEQKGPDPAPPELPERFHHLKNWLDLVRSIWRGEPGSNLLLTELRIPFREYSPGEPPLQMLADWRRGEFQYTPLTAFQGAMYLLLRNSSRAKICENPNCQYEPYFLRSKRVQSYCSQECAAEFQRKWKKRWWAEHGEEWRQKRQKKARAKVRSKGGKSK